MDVKTGLIAALLIHFQIVQSLNQVTLGIVTSTPYQCDKEIKLKCTYNGSTCCTANRIWRADGFPVMTNGVEAAGYNMKYEEGEINTSEQYFILIIKNVRQADLNKKYSCRYSTTDLQNAVTIDNSCYCKDCCWQCILFGLFGLVVAFIIELSVNYKLLSAKDHVRKAIVVGIEGSVITVAAAGSIGYFLCPCLSKMGPIFIAVGFFFGSALLLVLLYQYKFGDKDAEGLCQLISLGVLTIGIWIVVKKCTNGRK